MRRRPKRHWPNAVMRSYREIVSIRQSTNLAGLGQTTAPGHVGNDDIRCISLYEVTKAKASENSLALAQGHLGGGLETGKGFRIVGRHDFFQPHDIVWFKRPGDTHGCRQVPVSVTFNGDGHLVAHDPTNVFDGGDSLLEVFIVQKMCQ